VHEYGERGSAGDKEMGGKTERGSAQETERWEGSVALYPAGKAFSENRVRTEKQIGEEGNR
jgi:hypothetical protein